MHAKLYIKHKVNFKVPQNQGYGKEAKSSLKLQTMTACTCQTSRRNGKYFKEPKIDVILASKIEPSEIDNYPKQLTFSFESELHIKPFQAKMKPQIYSLENLHLNHLYVFDEQMDQVLIRLGLPTKKQIS